MLEFLAPSKVTTVFNSLALVLTNAFKESDLPRSIQVLHNSGHDRIDLHWF